MPMWRKILNGCGCLFLLSLLGFGIFGYTMYKKMSSQTPEQVAQMAAEVAPGAKAPAGFQPGMGMDLAGIRMAGFEDKKGRREVTVMLVPTEANAPIPTKEEVVPALVASLAQEDRKRMRQSSQEQTVVVKSQKGSFQCLQRKVESAGEPARWEWTALAWAPSERNHLVMILAHSPKKEDKFFSEFMAGLQLEPCQK